MPSAAFPHTYLALPRRRGDAARFVSGGTGSSLNIKKFIKHIILRYTVPGIPWLHLIFLARDIVSVLAWIDVEVVGTPPANEANSARPQPIRSIHPCLPRTLPPSVSSCSNLRICGMHAARGEDLAAMMASVRRSKGPSASPRFIHPVYNISDISWSAEPTQQAASPTFFTSRGHILEVKIDSNIESPWQLLKLFITTNPTHPAPKPGHRPMYVDAGELECVESLLAWVKTHAKRDAHIFLELCPSSGESSQAGLHDVPLIHAQRNQSSLASPASPSHSVSQATLPHA